MSRSRKYWLAWALPGIAVLLIAAVAIWWFRPAFHPATSAASLTNYPGLQIQPAFSPDGQKVAFAWDGEKRENFDIYVKAVGAKAPLRLTSNPAAEYHPAWSPDGRYIAFCRAASDHFEIWSLSAQGGAERKLGEAAVCEGLSWSSDGKYLAVVDKVAPQAPNSIFSLALETGEKRRLTSPANELLGDFSPRLSLDGKTLAFRRASSTENNDVYVLRVGAGGTADGAPRRLTFRKDTVSGFDWTADGHGIVFLAGANLWMISATGGIQQRLVGASENATNLSVSRIGSRVVYERDVFDLNIWRTPGPNSSDKDGAPSRFIASIQPDLEPQFSPDGKKIAFSSARSGNAEIWVCDHEGRNPVKLTSFNGPTLGSPRWSPDSRWIAFDSAKAGNSDIYVISADGGQPRRLTAGLSNNVRPSWSRYGRWIYFGSDRSGDSQIWKVPAQGGAAVQVTRTRGGVEAFESADGKFVFYAGMAAFGIWKVPTDGGEESLMLEEGDQNHWALTDSGICFFDLSRPGGPALKFYSFKAGKATLLRQFSKETKVDAFSTALSVSPDGRWILYTQVDRAGSDLMLVENYR